MGATESSMNSEGGIEQRSVEDTLDIFKQCGMADGQADEFRENMGDFMTCFLLAMGDKLNIDQKLFTLVSYIMKGTVPDEVGEELTKVTESVGLIKPDDERTLHEIYQSVVVEGLNTVCTISHISEDECRIKFSLSDDEGMWKLESILLRSDDSS